MYVCLKVCVSVWLYMFVSVCICVCVFAGVLCKISSALSAQHAFQFPVLTGKRGVSFCESWCFWRLPSRFLISNLQHGTISQSLKHWNSYLCTKYLLWKLSSLMLILVIPVTNRHLDLVKSSYITFCVFSVCCYFCQIFRCYMNFKMQISEVFRL